MDEDPIVMLKRDGSNYSHWSHMMSNYMFISRRDLWDYVCGIVTQPNPGHENYTKLFKDWKTSNAEILEMISEAVINPSVLIQLRSFKSGKEAWDYLADLYGQSTFAKKYQLETEIRATKQGDRTIKEFHDVMVGLWDQLAKLENRDLSMRSSYKEHRDEQRLVQFLIALRDEFEPIRKSILCRSFLPSVETAVRELAAEEEKRLKSSIVSKFSNLSIKSGDSFQIGKVNNVGITQVDYPSSIMNQLLNNTTSMFAGPVSAFHLDSVFDCENVMAKLGNGDWIPKERWREGDGDQGKGVKFGLFTVFVDNLPSTMVAKTLFKLFSQFGIVKEVFIPLKRRTVSKSRFGFVRFNCPVAADIAIQKGNGLLVEERVLEVKKATKDRSIRFEQSRRESHSINRPPDPIRYKAQVPCSGQRSFAEVLKGVTPTVARKESLSIKANEEDLGWLHGSVIVRFNSEFSTINIGNILKEKGLDHVMVRKGGGRDVVLTFKSQEELESNLCNIKEWFKEWSQFVMEWKPGFFLAQERCVWLRCYGIPLNLWNRGTINNIGSMWGTVLSLDGDFCQPKSFSHTRIRVATSCMEFINKTISLDCKGIVHPILVCEDPLAESSSLKGNGLEECSSNEIHGSVMERSSPEECFREKESDHVMQVNPVVEESKWDKGFIREEEVCTKVLDQRIGSNDCHLGEEVNTVIEETILEESVHSPNVIVEQVSTPGFIKSFSGSHVGSGFGINLEVDLSQALSKNLNKKGLLSLNQSGLVRQPTSVPKLMREEKRRKKKKVQLEGFTSFARLHGQKVAAVSKHTSKSVIFRPAVAAIARSDLSEDISSPNNLLLNEAKATIQLGKSLGINFNGEEDDVLNKIIELELKDKERSK